jgi:DNA invertase Pin-like site-specific DNA recombinase
MTEAAKAPRTALYVRVSKEEQDVDVQLDDLRAEAPRRKWRIVGVYEDEGVSGSKDRRPGLDRLVADVQAGKLDLVVVVKLDRLGRSLQHLLKLIAIFEDHDVGFVSLNDAGIDTTSPTGRLLLQILGSFAEYELAILKERTRAGLRLARKKGKTLGRPRVELDLRAARVLLKDHSVRKTADMLGVPRSTLRRRLAELDRAGPERSAVSPR